MPRRIGGLAARAYPVTRTIAICMPNFRNFQRPSSLHHASRRSAIRLGVDPSVCGSLVANVPGTVRARTAVSAVSPIAIRNGSGTQRPMVRVTRRPSPATMFRGPPMRSFMGAA